MRRWHANADPLRALLEQTEYRQFREIVPGGVASQKIMVTTRLVAHVRAREKKYVLAVAEVQRGPRQWITSGLAPAGAAVWARPALSTCRRMPATWSRGDICVSDHSLRNAAAVHDRVSGQDGAERENSAATRAASALQQFRRVLS
jgi:hypothetical protein